MKKLAFILISLFLSNGLVQSQEFKIHDNGLMYSDTTIGQLKTIVKDLNLKFAQCDFDRTLFSVKQSLGNFIILEGEDIESAILDLKNGISFGEFQHKYTDAKIEERLVIIKEKYTNYKEIEVVEFNSLLSNNKLYFESEPDLYGLKVDGSWLFNHYEKTDYRKERLEAIYFIKEFERKELPKVYSELIEYSDCLIDTNSRIYRDDAKRGGYYYEKDTTLHKVSDFLEYANTMTSKPKYKYKNDDDEETLYNEYVSKIKEWASKHDSVVKANLLTDRKFNLLFREAIDEAKREKNSNEEFESYVWKYVSKSEALEMKRNRIVVGQCSMDDSPRVHAMQIAILSAESTNWEVFLRAHLDIMNDRFSRVSDGSYAWKGRETYIKELEQLDINVLDLMLGITLRIDNESKNHYYGSIGRLGRALSETENKAELENRLLTMIKDNGLDDFNRVLCCFLYSNYNYYLEDDERKAKNNERLKSSLVYMPDYLASRLAKQLED